jgi:protein involved in polysaccharide export with SLBB domain
MKLIGRGLAGLAVLMTGWLLAGCGTFSGPTYQYDPLGVSNQAKSAGGDTGTNGTGGGLINVGDELMVSFADVDPAIQAITDTVKEDGSITLIFNKKFTAAGKSVGQLQDEIHDKYVPDYYRNLTPSIKIQSRFYYISGQVRTPGRQAYSGKMTVLGAIDTGGGYTDFANKKKIRVTRANGQQIMVDGIKAITDTSLNIEIFPNDTVYVYKRFW